MRYLLESDGDDAKKGGDGVEGMKYINWVAGGDFPRVSIIRAIALCVLHLGFSVRAARIL